MSLSPHDAQQFLLLYLQKRTSVEIAEMLGLSVEQVEQLRERIARHALQKLAREKRS